MGGGWEYRGRDCMVVGCTINAISFYRISIRSRCTTLCDKVCQWLATGQWFSPCPLVSSTNKTDRHNITEILLKVALNTINQKNMALWVVYSSYLFLKCPWHLWLCGGMLNCYGWMHSVRFQIDSCIYTYKSKITTLQHSDFIPSLSSRKGR
jgi:hypothetical protein